MIFLLLLRTCIDILFLGHVMSCLEFLRSIFFDLEYFGVTYTLAGGILGLYAVMSIYSYI